MLYLKLNLQSPPLSHKALCKGKYFENIRAKCSQGLFSSQLLFILILSTPGNEFQKGSHKFISSKIIFISRIKFKEGRVTRLLIKGQLECLSNFCVQGIVLDTLKQIISFNPTKDLERCISFTDKETEAYCFPAIHPFQTCSAQYDSLQPHVPSEHLKICLY